jgi:hypothetical protein
VAVAQLNPADFGILNGVDRPIGLPQIIVAGGLNFGGPVTFLFNHPNFGPPGNIVGTPTFGKITRTRFSTGEGGSSRQIQPAVKLSF